MNHTSRFSVAKWMAKAQRHIFMLAAILLLSSAFLKAQTTLDVIYLKNGSVVKGTIIETLIGQSVKIQTRDGNLFVYKMEEIEKIAKETVGQEQSQMTQQKQRAVLAGQIGVFNTAVDNFDKVYGSSSVFCFGGEGEFILSEQFGLIGRFKYFKKSGEPLTYTSGGATVTGTASWSQYWVVIGGKMHVKTKSQVTPFFGAGAGYFNVTESVSATASYAGQSQSLSVSASDNTWGLTLIGGATIDITEVTSIVGELEFTTASIKGQGGVGGKDVSVGGLFLGIGLQFGL